MSRDSSFTYIHLRAAHHAELAEEFNRTHLEPEHIFVAPQHQPLNPEDEDDVIPNEHAAFGIQRATRRKVESEWRDLGLERITEEGPPRGPGTAGGTSATRTIR